MLSDIFLNWSILGLVLVGCLPSGFPASRRGVLILITVGGPFVWVVFTVASLLTYFSLWYSPKKD